ITDVEAFAYPQHGDLNRDGQVDVGDVAAMLSALCDEPAFAAAHGLTIDQLALVGDLNGDGKFTNADIQQLLTTLGTQYAGSGALASVPEPTSFTLLALCGLALGALEGRLKRQHVTADHHS